MVCLVLPLAVRGVDEARRVLGQIVAGDGPGPPSATAAEPSVFAFAALALEELLALSEILENGRRAPDIGEGLVSDVAAAYLDERARPHIAVGFDVDEPAPGGATMEDSFSKSQEGAAVDTRALQEERPVLWTRYGLHDGVGDALGFRHEANQTLVGAQVEGGWRAR